jgi:hypothetical protein
MHALTHTLTSLPRSALVFLAAYIAGLVSWALTRRRSR